MRREQLEHLIRAAGVITGSRRISARLADPWLLRDRPAVTATDDDRWTAIRQRIALDVRLASSPCDEDQT